mgnify:CR=1 FL=1
MWLYIALGFLAGAMFIVVVCFIWANMGSKNNQAEFARKMEVYWIENNNLNRQRNEQLQNIRMTIQGKI